MDDSRKILDRIAAFRQKLDGAPVPPTPADVADRPGDFDRALRSLVGPGEVNEGPLPPQITSRTQRLLRETRELVAWQRRFTSDPVFAGLAAAAGEAAAGAPAALPDPLLSYHRETVAIVDSAVRLVQAFPESPTVQAKLCDGLEGVLGIVKERHAVQERAMSLRRADLHRVDRLAAVFAALHQRRAVTLKPLAALAEEILEDVRQGKPLRFLEVAPGSTVAYAGGLTFPAPARFLAAHAINAAQAVARMVGYDYEWAALPLLPVVAALLADCGMMRVPAEVLAQPGPLSPADRRLIEEHPRHGADLLLACLAESAPLAEAVAAHHERPDGTGYPLGLKGAELKPLGRMLAVADAYAALSAARPHRPARDSRAALTDVLLMGEDGRLDRDFCEYLAHLSFYPVGSIVELADGRVGSVVALNANKMDPRAGGRPVVAVLADADGRTLPRPEHVDLSATDRGGIAGTLPAARRREVLGGRYPDLA